MRRRAAALPLWALCLTLVLLASILWRPDIPIDETRYVSVAWEMWSGGDWLVPHRNGLPYHHKPPLLFWLINLGWHLFGVNDWWPRAISALFSFTSLALLFPLARRLWPDDGEAVAERAGWLLIGSVFWLLFSTSVVFDVMLTACVLLALLAGLRLRDGEAGRALLALAIGAGVLAKGPVVLLHVLPVLLFAPWWSQAPGGGWKRWYGAVGLGVLGGAAIALCWAVPAAYSGGPEFRHAIFWGQTVDRVAGSLAHNQPAYWYLALLPVIVFPWLFWAGSWRALAAVWRARGDTGNRFCFFWLLPTFVGFSLAHGKQVHYLLPLLPGLALLLAAGLRRGPVSSGRLASLPLYLVLAALGALVALAPARFGADWLNVWIGSDWLVGGALLAAAAVLGLLWGRSSPVGIGGAGLIVALLLHAALLRPLAPLFDTTPLATHIATLQAQGIPVAHASAYNDQFHYYGRLTQPLEEISRGEITSWLAAHPQGRVITYLPNPQVATVAPEFSQPFLERSAVLLDAAAAARLTASTLPAGEAKGRDEE